MRVVIGGWPDAGKTTLALAMAEDPRHTDDLQDEVEDWDESGQIAAEWMRSPGPWLIEGVHVVYGLKKYLRDHATAPCDRLIWLRTPDDLVNERHVVMNKGLETMLRQVRDELLNRGVVIEEFVPRAKST